MYSERSFLLSLAGIPVVKVFPFHLEQNNLSRQANVYILLMHNVKH